MILKNYLYNIVYQIVVLIIPLVTAPYIARVLGSDGVGINGFTNSIIQYFILFGTMGISLYGNRAIAYVRDDKAELSRTFWGIFFLQFCFTGLAYVIFIVFDLMYYRYQTILLLQSIFIIAAMFDISWLFMGLEDFKKTVIRNTLVKVIGVICIFIFVRHNDDLWKFVLILSLSQFLGQLTMWAYIPKVVHFIKIKWTDIKKHFYPSISLFIPQVAIQVYVVLNKTMLGQLSTASEVGYFDYSDRIVKMLLAIVTAMGLVMLPRVSNTYAKGDMEKVRMYLRKSFDFASYLSIPLALGLAATAETFVPWFFTLDFAKSGEIMVVISPIIILIAWSNVLGQQFLLPTGQVRGFTLSVSSAAIVNFILNLCLIPYLQSVGTAIATVVAELSVTFLQFYFVKDQVRVRELFQSSWKYFISGLVMYGIIKGVTLFFPAKLFTTVLQVVIGVPVYFIMLFILKSQTNKFIFSKIFSIIAKKSKRG